MSEVVVNTGTYKAIVAETENGNDVNVSTPDGVNTEVVINGGLPIPFGVAGIDSFVWTQSAASNTWIITHNLGKKPGGIIVKDTAEAQWVGEVSYIDNNSLSIFFGSASFAGKAYLS